MREVLRRYQGMTGKASQVDAKHRQVELDIDEHADIGGHIRQLRVAEVRHHLVAVVRNR